MGIAQRIKSWREAAGLTQAQLAKQLGISQTYLSDLEHGRGRLRVDLMQRIADLCSVDDDEWKAARSDSKAVTA